MNTKLYTYKRSTLKNYKRKNVFMILLLAGILFSMYSCQYEVVPIGTTISVGTTVPIGAPFTRTN